MATTTHNVRVSFVTRGYGIALTIDEQALARAVEQGRSQTTDQPSVPETGEQVRDEPDRTEIDVTDGVLRVSDAVVTLELPTVDGRSSVLAWDPAEVEWSSLLTG